MGAILCLLAIRQAADGRGYVDLGHGRWVRVMGITEMRGGKPMSWDIGGRLTPRAIVWDPGMLARSTSPEAVRLKKARDFLVFTTNLQDVSGFRVKGMVSAFAHAPYLAGLYEGPGQSTGVGAPITGGEVYCVPVSLPRSGAYRFDFSVAGGDWAEVASATYRDDRRVAVSGHPYFPAVLQREGNRLSIPAGAFSRLRVGVHGSYAPHGRKPLSAAQRAFSDSLELDRSRRFSKFWGDVMLQPTIGLTLEGMAPARSFVVGGIAAHPAGGAMEAVAPPGMPWVSAEGHVATFGNYTVTLESISRFENGKPVSWTSTGVLLPHDSDLDTAPQDDEAATKPDARVLKFLVVSSKPSPRARPGEMLQADLFDAAGFGMDNSSISSSNDDRSAETTCAFVATVGKSQEAQDFVLRFPDSALQTVTRMPLSAAYVNRSFVMARWNEDRNGKSVSAEHPTLVGSKTPSLGKLVSDPVTYTQIIYLDRRGLPVDVELRAGRDKDEIVSKRAKEIVGVEVYRQPYVYVRFRSVAMKSK